MGTLTLCRWGCCLLTGFGRKMLTGTKSENAQMRSFPISIPKCVSYIRRHLLTTLHGLMSK